MSIIRSVLVITCLLVLSLAEASAAIPCTPGATVRYINGVHKEYPEEIEQSADLLRERLEAQGVACISDVLYLHNPSDGIVADILLEVALQKVTERGILFADAMLIVTGAAYSYTPYGVATNLLMSDGEATALRQRIIAHIQDASLSSYIFTLNGSVYTTGDLVNEFRDKVLLDLSRGTKTVLVAHSQGNLFANETFNAVRGTAPESLYRGLSVVNVANAASSAPSQLYITSREDLVIDLMVAMGYSPMFPNVGAGFSTADRLGHGFEEIYLSTSLPSGAPLQDSMAGRVCALVQAALNGSIDPAGSIIASTFSSLVRIDVASRSAQTLGSFTTSSGSAIPVYDIALNPRGGQAVAISPNALSSFDPGVRVLSLLPQSSIGGNALTFNADGELFAMSGNQFFEIDPTTGQIIGTPLTLPFSYTSSGDLTFDNDGNLFATAVASNGQDVLLKIDTLRKQILVIGNTGYSQVWGLYFSGGVLYGATSNGNLISIDRATGAGTFVAVLNVGGISGLQ